MAAFEPAGNGKGDMSGMTLEVRPQGGGAVFVLGGRMMYESDALQFRRNLEAELEHGRKWFVLDLSGVIGMSSTGLGILISAHRTLRERGAGFYLANLSPKVSTVLQITRLNSVFQIFDSVEEAVRTAGSR